MRKARYLAAALCAAVLLCGFTLPAYAYADEGGNTGGADLWEGLDPAVTAPAPAPAPEPEQKPFTPDGTGTVVDNATDAEDKEFFTITTEDEAVFYLVIDRQRGSENVYFLNAVTVADLAALAELPEGAAPVTPAPEPDPGHDPAPDVEPEPTPQPEAKSNAGTLLLVAAVVLIGGRAAFYFKIYRPKHQAAPVEDYPDEPDYEDAPPWEEDEDGDGDTEDGE